MDYVKSSEYRVMVVDDEADICDMVAEVLKTAGYHPITCTHPGEALSIFEQEDVGLAFVDISLPDMTGLELASELKKRNPLLEVVFVTGHGTFYMAVQALKIGAYDYVRKPFGVSEIRLCLKRYQERCELRRQIRLTEQRHFDLVQSIPLLIFELRSDFGLEFINRACSAMLGYDPMEAINDPAWFLERIHVQDSDRVKTLFLDFFDGGKPHFSTGCRLIHKDGHVIHGIVKSIPYTYQESGGKIDRLDGIIVDITDRVFLERALIQREKLKTLGAISAEVAHEIRNPLVSIGGFAKRLQKRVPDLPESDIILRESLRLEKILDRISKYLKPVEITYEECSVNAVVSECVRILSPEIRRRRVSCKLKLALDIPTVHTDPDILTHVFTNLIRNALEAIDREKSLGIKSYQSDENVHVDFRHEVSFSKPVDPELLFLPFDERGQGIGLPNCYQLLKKIDGLLTFVQERDQMVFTVSLPKSGEDPTAWEGQKNGMGSKV